MWPHGIKGFVIPTISFVKIGITKIFCYNNKIFSPINKTFGCCSEIFGCSNKKIFVVPNFVAVTKPFFPVILCYVVCPPLTVALLRQVWIDCVLYEQAGSAIVPFGHDDGLNMGTSRLAPLQVQLTAQHTLQEEQHLPSEH